MAARPRAMSSRGADGADLPAEQKIRSLAALRVVTDDQRHRMLSALIAEPLGAREIARQLRLLRTQVYYHLKLLEQHGFIRPAGERISGRMVERLYRATARHYSVDTQHIGTKGRRGLMQARAELLEHVADDLRAQAARPSGKPHDALVVRELLHLRPQQLAALREKITELVGSLDSSQRQGEPVELAIALFPVRARGKSR
jgi:DNA-binding transcriptional ArsR family regulator